MIVRSRAGLPENTYEVLEALNVLSQSLLVCSEGGLAGVMVCLAGTMSVRSTETLHAMYLGILEFIRQK